MRVRAADHRRGEQAGSDIGRVTPRPLRSRESSCRRSACPMPWPVGFSLLFCHSRMSDGGRGIPRQPLDSPQWPRETGKQQQVKPGRAENFLSGSTESTAAEGPSAALTSVADGRVRRHVPAAPPDRSTLFRGL